VVELHKNAVADVAVAKSTLRVSMASNGKDSQATKHAKAAKADAKDRVIRFKLQLNGFEGIINHFNGTYPFENLLQNRLDFGIDNLFPLAKSTFDSIGATSKLVADLENSNNSAQMGSDSKLAKISPIILSKLVKSTNSTKSLSVNFITEARDFYQIVLGCKE